MISSSLSGQEFPRKFRLHADATNTGGLEIPFLNAVVRSWSRDGSEIISSGCGCVLDADYTVGGINTVLSAMHV